jgi:hypothetical protein
LAALAIVAILVAAAASSVWVLPRAVWVPVLPTGRLVLALCCGLSRLFGAGWVYFILPAYWD